jgi:transketolase
MKRWVKGMRDVFFYSLYNLAKRDKDIILITADTGAICHDEFKQKLSNQYINIGIAEQNMVGVAAGLAMSGKIVYIYAIIPFVTMRCYEQIRVDLCCMNLPVTIVGVGAGFDYSTLGPTHHGTEDIALMRSLPEMTIYSPADSLMADFLARVSYKQSGPKYIRLDRTGYPLIYKDTKEIDVSKGFSLLKKGNDLYIIATGRMVYTALKVAKKLSALSIHAGVVDLFKIKPIDEEMLWDVIKKVRYVVTLEEHFVTGGIGDAVADMLITRINIPVLKSIGIPNQFCRKYGTREYLQHLNKLDVDSVTVSIRKWIKKIAR